MTHDFLYPSGVDRVELSRRCSRPEGQGLKTTDKPLRALFRNISGVFFTIAYAVDSLFKDFLGVRRKRSESSR